MDLQYIEATSDSTHLTLVSIIPTVCTHQNQVIPVSRVPEFIRKGPPVADRPQLSISLETHVNACMVKRPQYSSDSTPSCTISPSLTWTGRSGRTGSAGCCGLNGTAPCIHQLGISSCVRWIETPIPGLGVWWEYLQSWMVSPITIGCYGSREFLDIGTCISTAARCSCLFRFTASSVLLRCQVSDGY